MRARRWLESLNEPVLTTDCVVLETFNNLSGFAIRERCHVVMNGLLSRPDLKLIRAHSTLFDAALKLHRERPDRTWSLTDCISFVLMKQRDLTAALAFDHHFEQAGFEALLRCEPG